MKIKRVDHIQIAVPPELEGAAIEFYGDVLGLTRLTKPEGTGDKRGAWFAAGDIQVHVGIQQKDFEPATKAHPGFIVNDLDEAAKTLKQAGSDVVAGGDIPGFKRIFSTDPAGNRLEFLQAVDE